jgi:CRISPR-associated exonuclease Cas4
VELEHTEEDYTEVERVLAEILEVIRTGVFPAGTAWKARCRDCCYRNICIQ